MPEFSLGVCFGYLSQQLDLWYTQKSVGEPERDSAGETNLICHRLQHPQHISISLHESHMLVHESLISLELLALERPIFDQLLLLLDPLLHFLRDSSEAESRDARKEVMRRLKVETAVKEVEVGRARNVHRGAKLAVGMRLEQLGVRDNIGGDGDGLREVRKDDLWKCNGNSECKASQ